MKVKSKLAYPYIVWMILFTIIPMLLVLYYSFTLTKSSETFFTLAHFSRLLQPVYFKVIARSIGLALICTFACLILGYPMAMILAKSKNSDLLMFLFMAPMWMNLLLRTYSWLTLLEKNGLINTILSFLGFEKVNLLYTSTAVVLGMIYNFLPFMVLPISSVLKKIDSSVLEAAEDLGANYFTRLVKIIIPLSIPGIISGITMVFMPAVSTFVISTLLGGSQYTLVGNLIEQQFLTVGDWSFGSAIAIVMMVVILGSMAIMSIVDKDGEGGNLL
jgi:spermidine/putrescine transport system permease protein